MTKIDPVLEQVEKDEKLAKIDPVLEQAEKDGKVAKIDPVLEQVEKDRKFVLENEWMIRPCTLYDAEYAECKAIRSRFYQYYRDGETTDCNVWYTNYKDCKQYEKKDDYAAGARLIRSEKEKLDRRIKLHEDNDVWKPRKIRPPPNWTAPLPPHLEEKRKESYFHGREDKMREKLEIMGGRCTIC